MLHYTRGDQGCIIKSGKLAAECSLEEEKRFVPLDTHAPLRSIIEMLGFASFKKFFQLFLKVNCLVIIIFCLCGNHIVVKARLAIFNDCIIY